MISNKCPSCGGKLTITEFTCEKCKLKVNGRFDLVSFDLLEEKEIEFVKCFLATFGNIKKMEKILNISYPTVKNKMAKILEKLGISEYDYEFKDKKMEILQKLEKGEITPQEAVKMIRDLNL